MKQNAARLRISADTYRNILNTRITPSDYRRIITEANKKSAHMVALKPGRKLGAVWIDDFVQRRQNVNLCEECWRKYDRWWLKYDYAPQWNIWKRTDCDGCAKTMHLCVGFYPKERYWSSIFQVRSVPI